MAKDPFDQHTLDGLPRRAGRPCTDPERGPMSGAERQRRRRKKLRARGGGSLREISMPDRAWERLEEIARRKGIEPSVALACIVKETRLPKKSRANVD